MSSQSPVREPRKVDFAALPLDKNGPHGNAWGRWGPDDQLGTLNILTDDVVAKAVSECVKTGQRTSLKYESNLYLHPGGLTKTVQLDSRRANIPSFSKEDFESQNH